MTEDTTQFLNLAALQQEPLVSAPYPHVLIPNFIQSEYLAELVQAFPDLNYRGSIPASSITPTLIFQQFINELEGDALRYAVMEKFEMELRNKPTLLTLRGYTTQRDGHIHTDSKDKLITVLLYMNSTWDTADGSLRLLNSKESLKDYFLEAPPLAGTCVMFAVTPNCWHGHKPFVGKRLSMQLNYLTGQAALSKHHNLHQFTTLLKQKFGRLWNPPNR